MKNKIKKFLKKTVTFALAAFTVVGTAGTAVSPIKTTTVHADAAEKGIDQHMWDVITELVGGRPNTDGQFHDLGHYGASGANYTGTWQYQHDKTADQIKAEMDCSRSTVWIFSHWLDKNNSNLTKVGMSEQNGYMGDGLAGQLQAMEGKYYRYTRG